jgi:hypothetical protein
VSHLDLPQVRHNDAQLHFAALLLVLLDASDQPRPFLLFVFALPAPSSDVSVAPPFRGGLFRTLKVSPN